MQNPHGVSQWGRGAREGLARTTAGEPHPGWRAAEDIAASAGLRQVLAFPAFAWPFCSSEREDSAGTRGFPIRSSAPHKKEGFRVLTRSWGTQSHPRLLLAEPARLRSSRMRKVRASQEVVWAQACGASWHPYATAMPGRATDSARITEHHPVPSCASALSSCDKLARTRAAMQGIVAESNTSWPSPRREGSEVRASTASTSTGTDPVRTRARKQNPNACSRSVRFPSAAVQATDAMEPLPHGGARMPGLKIRASGVTAKVRRDGGPDGARLDAVASPRPHRGRPSPHLRVRPLQPRRRIVRRSARSPARYDRAAGEAHERGDAHFPADFRATGRPARDDGAARELQRVRPWTFDRLCSIKPRPA